MSSKMATRPQSNATKYQESLVTSIAALWLAVASFSFVYAYFALVQYDRIRALTILSGIDQLLAIREIALGDHLGSDELTKRELLHFFPKASAEAYKQATSGANPYQVEVLDDKGFTTEPIERSFVVNVMSRLGQRYCKVAVTRLPAGDRFNFATFQIVGKTYWANSENVEFVAFDNCISSANFGQPYLILRSGRDVVIAVPAKIESDFPPIAPLLPLKSFEFDDRDKLARLLPHEIRNFSELSGSMVMVHLAAIEHFVLRHATLRHGKYYSPTEFDTAVSALYQEQDRSASFLGMNAPISTLIVGGPFVYILLCFELWRRVRRVSCSIAVPSVFWFATDTVDPVGRWTAKVYALLPVAGTVVVFGSFALATQSTFLYSDYLLRAKVLFGSDVSIRDVLEWVPISFFSTLLFLLIPFQAMIAVKTTKTLLRIASASGPSIATRRTARNVWRLAALRRAKRQSD